MSDTDDLATLLARREHARPNKVTWTLLVLLILAVGFAGGAFVAKRTSNASSGLPDFAAMRGAGGPPTGVMTTPGGAIAAPTDASADATVGTVKLVDGNNLYMTDADGNTVKVIVPETASVTSQVDSTLSELTAGTSVTVRGATAEDGTVTAESVTQGDN